LAPSPLDKASFGKSFNIAASEQRKRHILVILEIHSFESLQELKKQVWSLLNTHHNFLRPHLLAFHQVNTTAIGWFTHANLTRWGGWIKNSF
jgi:hypothetical protein